MGIASTSDKWYKKILHGRRRARVRDAINTGEYEDAEIDLPYEEWAAPKDGKQVFNPDKHPEFMRK
jgi:hypothetical protein